MGNITRTPRLAYVGGWRRGYFISLYNFLSHHHKMRQIWASLPHLHFGISAENKWHKMASEEDATADKDRKVKVEQNCESIRKQVELLGNQINMSRFDQFKYVII